MVRVNKFLSKLLLTTITILLIFNISCSGDVSDNNKNGVDASLQAKAGSDSQLTVYFEKPSDWNEAWIWFDSGSDGSWETTSLKQLPGDMEQYRTVEGNDWYKKEFADVNSVTFLFNGGDWSKKVANFPNGGTDFVATSKVWIRSDGNMLLSDPFPGEPEIVVTPGSSEFHSEQLFVTIEINSDVEVSEQYYLINGVRCDTVTSPINIDIAEGMEVGDQKKLLVVATNEYGTTQSEEFTYSKIEKPQGINVYFEKPSDWNEAWIWYDKDSDDVWETTVLRQTPGDMEKYRTVEGLDWYRKTVIDTNSVTFLFNGGNWNQKISDSQNGGIDFTKTENVWVRADGVAYNYDPVATTPQVNVSPEGEKFSSNTCEVSIEIISSSNVTDRYYLLDNVKTNLNSNNEKIVIGANMNVGDIKNLQVFATNADGTTETDEYQFEKIDPTQGIVINFEKPSDWSDAWIWYDKDSDDVWETTVLCQSPGDMQKYRTVDGLDWYKKVIADTETVTFLFNGGAWSQKISNGSSDFVATKECWVQKDGTMTDYDPKPATKPVVTATSNGEYKGSTQISISIESQLEVTEKYYEVDNVKHTINGNSTSFMLSMYLTNDGDEKDFIIYSKNSLGETIEYRTYKRNDTVVTATPFSWNNATVYFVLTDRFLDGDSTNNHSYGRELDRNGNAYAGYENKIATFNGGDLRGLIKKLDEGYFTNLGINAIWITSPVEQMHGWIGGENFRHYAYHGYYALDYTEVDKNMGTAADLKEFVDKAHAAGIRVVLDVVMNHAGYESLKDMDEYNFGELVGDWRSYYYDKPETDAHYNTYANYVGKTSADRWALWWGPDWIRKTYKDSNNNQYAFPGYDPVDGSEEKRCLDGLPDFKTESNQVLGLPELLKTKWNSDKENLENQELNDYFQRSGNPRYARYYLIKWITDYVREYGIDGFRCDTIKHVEKSVWKELKVEADKAFDEWKSNNAAELAAIKDKYVPSEDFWMTGEHWGHGVDPNSSYYSSGGFDSIINFSFQGSAGNVESMKGIYSDYSNWFNNSTSNGNALSYISSHDKGLGGRGNIIDAGTTLLLLPGGVQIFYGDETNRQADDSRPWMEPARTKMNWDSIDTNCLSHFQKLGQFRYKHISVGAGQHASLTTNSGFAFKRTYNNNGVVDNVVCVIGGSGSVTIDVSSVFANGTSVRNYYAGENSTAKTVESGEVTFTAINGVILIEQAN